MEKLSRKILFASIILIVLIIIIIIAILFINRKNRGGTDENLNTAFEMRVTYQGSNTVKKVDNANKYFAVENLINNYFKNINDLNNYVADDVNANIFNEAEIQIIIQERKDEVRGTLESILPEEYRNNIDSAIQKENERIRNNQSTDIKEMYVTEKDASINIFFVILDGDTDVSVMLVTDSNNSSYMIYPMQYVIDNNYNSIKVGDNIEFDIDSVKSNENNKFSYTNVSEEQLVRLYFSDYKELLENDPEALYDKLSTEYATARFINKDNFIAYVEKNINELSGASAGQYLINTYDGYTEYVIKDQYENTYVFKAEGIMDYELTLDTYTIISNTFKNTYDGADDQGKTMLNCDKWIQMLNNRDYTSAYNVLDETFRNNNFGSVDNFENYMRQNYGEHYDVEFGDFSNEGNTYVQPLTLTTISGSGENKEITIIMRLNENYGFTMSFVM